MNDIQRQHVMDMLKAKFHSETIVSREEAETITGLTERSIARAYFAETGECIVKIDPIDMPSMCSKVTHVSYIRVRDMDAEQVVSLGGYVDKYVEGVNAFKDILTKQLDDRKNVLLLGK